MSLRVRDLINLEVMQGVHVIVPGDLERGVRWVHTWPEVHPWLHGGELLLTTMHSWPPEPKEQRRILREFNRTQVAAILFQAGGRFFPEISPVIIEEARALNLTLMKAGEEISFVNLIETINREIIRSQFEIIERSDQIHRSLTEAALKAESVDTIIDCLTCFIKKRAVVLDRWLRPLTQPPAQWEAIRPQCEEIARSMNGELAYSPHRFQFASTAEGVAFAIHTGQEVSGYLFILSEEGASIIDLDVRAGEHAAVVIGLHFLRQREAAEAEARMRNSFVEAVLQGKLATDPSLRERAQLLGFDPSGIYAVVAAVCADDEGQVSIRPFVSPADFQTRDWLGHAVRAALEAFGYPVFMTFALNQVLCLIPVDSPAERFRHRIQGVWLNASQVAPHLKIAMAIGGPGRGDLDMPKSLNEARMTLAAARGSGVWWYEDMLVLRIIGSAADQEAIRALLDTTIRPLRLHGEVLCDTVQALIQTGFRQRLAARTLGIHWNTLRHRLARIEQILGKPLHDPELRLRICLAIEAEKIIQR